MAGPIGARSETKGITVIKAPELTQEQRAAIAAAKAAVESAMIDFDQAAYEEIVKEADDLRAENHALETDIKNKQRLIGELIDEIERLRAIPEPTIANIYADLDDMKAKERERCARVCDGKDDDLAEAIRALRDEP
jgi:hypothetical protein